MKKYFCILGFICILILIYNIGVSNAGFLGSYLGASMGASDAGREGGNVGEPIWPEDNETSIISCYSYNGSLCNRFGSNRGYTPEQWAKQNGFNKIIRRGIQTGAGPKGTSVFIIMEVK